MLVHFMKVLSQHQLLLLMAPVSCIWFCCAGTRTGEQD